MRPQAGQGRSPPRGVLPVQSWAECGAVSAMLEVSERILYTQSSTLTASLVIDCVYREQV